MPTKQRSRVTVQQKARCELHLLRQNDARYLAAAQPCSTMMHAQPTPPHREAAPGGNSDRKRRHRGGRPCRLAVTPFRGAPRFHPRFHLHMPAAFRCRSKREATSAAPAVACRGNACFGLRSSRRRGQPEGRSRGCYSEGAYGCRERHERVVRTSCAALACIAEP